MKTTTRVLTGLTVLLALAGCATSQPQSRHEITEWITQLHNCAYAKRNAAVQSLAHEPEISLPLLKRELKRETDSNHRWWLNVAIQQCEEQLPKPEEISASPDRSQGLQANEACKDGDGPFTIVEHDGVRCWQTPKHAGNAWSYLYFIADDAFREKAESALEIQLEYLDAGTGDIGLDSDSSDARASVNGASENHSLTVHRINTCQWRTVRFHINNARFHGSENGGSDFRFSCRDDSLLVRSVRVWPVGP